MNEVLLAFVKAHANYKRVFRWATENEMVPPTIYQALRAVAGLRRGRSAAKETEPIRPAPEADIEAVCDVVAMRGRELHRSGEVWRYVPAEHKTDHHGSERVVFVGPKARIR